MTVFMSRRHAYQAKLRHRFRGRNSDGHAAARALSPPESGVNNAPRTRLTIAYPALGGSTIG
jgi:hypothetical protein